MPYTKLQPHLSGYALTSDHRQLKHVCGITALLLSCCLTIFYWSPNPDFHPVQFWCPYVFIVLLTAPSCCSLLFWYCTALRRGCSTQDPSKDKKWTPNLRNTTWTAVTTAIATPLLLYLVWRSELQTTEIVVKKDEVHSVFYPSVALMQNVKWSSQASLTLDSKPKCFVGWMKDSLPTCDLAKKPGDWCNGTSLWDTTISSYVWQNTTYNMLAWNANEHMVNSRPTTPILAQAFFNFNSEKAFNDSFGHDSPSLWLAVWDTAISLQESLEYGYTRLQLIDAAATSSVSLDLIRKELPDRKPAYDYRISAITTVRQTDLTCDLGKDYYGPCRTTVLVQYPNFNRDVITHKKGMDQWEVAAAVGSWLSLFQVLSWLLSLLALQD